MPPQKTKGNCKFCGKSYAKSGIARHLATCQARAVKEAAWTTKPQRLFHLRIQGYHLPQYWMHIEMPVDETLGELDDFLRMAWLECCGHLSAFTIEGREYSDDTEVMSMFDLPDSDEDFEKAITEEFDEEANEDDIVQKMKGDISNLLTDMGANDNTVQQFMSDLDTLEKGINQEEEITPDQVEEVAGQMMQSMMEALGIDGLLNSPLVGGNMMPDLDFFDDEVPGSLDTKLSEVLKPGLEFQHEYDFGSTTELTLKVIGERDGKLNPDDDTVTILAQNEPPEFRCQQCHIKVAVAICMECRWTETGGVLCANCMNAHNCGWEMALPVVNSPRVGVCGYDGGVMLDYEYDD